MILGNEIFIFLRLFYLILICENVVFVGGVKVVDFVDYLWFLLNN